MFSIFHMIAAAPIYLLSQLPGSSGFNIYCTSNLDGTGACNRVDNDKPVDCLVIPGGVIDCKQPGEEPIQCVLYSSVLNSQAYFYCTRRTDPGVRNNKIKIDRFDQNSIPSPQPSTSNSSPLSDSLLPPVLQAPSNVINTPLNNGFD